MPSPTGTAREDDVHPFGDDTTPSPVGWGRGVLLSLAILAAGTALFVYLPNWCLTHLTGLSRNGRVAVATSVFVVVFLGFMWVLRRLQARRVI